MTHHFHPSVLREYDIRGIAGDTLKADDARAIGRSFAALLWQAGGRRVAVGQDGRLSSPMLADALVQGLLESGMDVLRIGVGPTPMLYYAEASAEHVDGGIQVTGSHNPANHNGFKMVFQGRPFFGDDIVELGRVAAEGRWRKGQGLLEHSDIMSAYVARLVEGVGGVSDEALSALRIGWDAGNGAAGQAVEQLTARLPGEHYLIFTEIDGNFPNHHPDPTIEHNLAELKALVAAKRLHFGIAFDGDGDRIGVVDGEGQVIWGDQLLMIFAQDLLKLSPGSIIIGDIKASRALFDRISAWGGRPVMWKSGHSQIKCKMKAIKAALGGEMSGHVFFADQYYGFDDALYAAVRLMAAVVRLGKSVTELHAEMPVMINTPELRFAVDDARKFAVIDEVRQRLPVSADVNDTDGVRVTTADGWWLLRASNTQAMLVARAESDSVAGLDRLLAVIDAQLAQSGLTRG